MAIATLLAGMPVAPTAAQADEPPVEILDCGVEQGASTRAETTPENIAEHEVIGPFTPCGTTSTVTAPPALVSGTCFELPCSAQASASVSAGATATVGADGVGVFSTSAQGSADASASGFGEASGSGSTGAGVKFKVNVTSTFQVSGAVSTEALNSNASLSLFPEGAGEAIFELTSGSNGSAGTLEPGIYHLQAIATMTAGATPTTSPSHAEGEAQGNLTVTPASASSSCPDEDAVSSVMVGFALAEGCFVERKDAEEHGTGIFETSDKAWVGGFEVQPRPGGLLILDTNAVALGEEGSGIDILFDGFPVPFGVDVLPVESSQGSVDLNKVGTIEKQILKLPVEGSVKVSWADGGKTASFDAEISLDKLTGPLGKLVTLQAGEGAGKGTGKISLKLTNRTGLVVSSAEAKVDEINVLPKALKIPKVIKFKNLFFKYERKEDKPFWSGGGLLTLPISSGDLSVGGKVFAFDGSLAGGGLAVDGINRRLGTTPLFLQNVQGDLIFRPKWGLNLGVGGSLGPQVAGKRLLSLEGSLIAGSLVPGADCPNGLDPAEDVITSKFAPTKSLESQGLFKSEMSGRVCNYGETPSAVEAKGKLAIDIPPINIGYEANQSGFIGTNGANLEGSAVLRLPGLPDLAGQAIVSTKGFAACTLINFFQGGIGYRWGQAGLPAPFKGCDLAPFRVTASSSAGASSAGASASKGVSALVPAGLPHVAFAASAAEGAPRVRVKGPGGVKFSSPPTGVRRSHAVVIVPSAGERKTYVIVNDPKPGKWRLTSLDPGQPLTKVAIARGLRPPKVRGRLNGRGARRILTYKLRPMRGQAVSFIERGPGVEHQLGRAHGRRGRIRFRPVRAKKRGRRILALVTQNGLPRAEVTIAHFRALARLRLGKPRVKAKRTKSSLTLSWPSVQGASHYLVEVRAGSRELASTLTPRVKLKLTRTPAVGRLKLNVTALSDTVPPGPPARLAVRPAGKKHRHRPGSR